jgi:hypothetical protein
MADIRTEETRDEGLTTAALANANLDEPASAKRDYNRDLDQRPVDTRSTGTAAFAANASAKSSTTEDQPSPLFSPEEAKDFHSRWDAIQVGFVDEPRQAVEQADSLVAGAMKRLAEGFADERARLEAQWDQGDNVSTEDLRVALRRYRSFFGRLLAV